MHADDGLAPLDAQPAPLTPSETAHVRSPHAGDDDEPRGHGPSTSHTIRARTSRPTHRSTRVSTDGVKGGRGRCRSGRNRSPVSPDSPATSRASSRRTAQDPPRHASWVNPPRYEVMLAVSRRPKGSLAGGWMETKLDGRRAIVAMNDGRVQVRSRRGSTSRLRSPNSDASSRWAGRWCLTASSSSEADVSATSTPFLGG